MKSTLVLLLGAVLAANGQVKTLLDPTWTGNGILRCYGHFSTDVSFDEGTQNGGPGDVTCRIVEWGGVLSPEAMFFSEDATGEEFQMWAVMLHTRFVNVGRL